VVLLGDSAHAMQPNLGQGGCMAIEDAYQLVLDLGQEAERAAEHSGAAAQMNVEGVLSGYMRVGPAFGMAAVGGHWLRVGCCDGMLALTGRLPRACPTALLNSAMRSRAGCRGPAPLHCSTVRCATFPTLLPTVCPARRSV
jgi:hypothetical protein